MLEIFRIIAGLLLVLFLPGFTLIMIFFPKKNALDSDLDLLYKAVLGSILSIVLTIFTGLGLSTAGINEDTGLGYMSGTNIISFLIGFTILFFLVGWYRGAYPFMERIHPKLLRYPKEGKDEFDVPFFVSKESDRRFKELTKEEYTLLEEIKGMEKKRDLHTGRDREYYDEKLKKKEERLVLVRRGLKDIEEETRNVMPDEGL